MTLWKVAMKCKIVMYFHSLGSFSKNVHLRFQNFISPSIKYLINLIFSVVVCICKIHVFNEVIPCQFIKVSGSCHPYRMDFFEILTSGRYHKDMKALKILASNSKHFRIYGISKKWQIGVPCVTF